MSLGNRWFYDQELEEHVLMERAPDGIWRELRRVATRLSMMRSVSRDAWTQSVAERLSIQRRRRLNEMKGVDGGEETGG